MAARLSIGSLSMNELHVSHDADEVRQSAWKVCEVCGGEIGYNKDGELFEACHLCGFPVCETCYQYQRTEGIRCCPQCNAHYKLRKAGDDADIDDFDHEFHTKDGDEDSRSAEQDDVNHMKNRGCNAEWRERIERWKVRQRKRALSGKDQGRHGHFQDDYLLTEARQPLWRKVPVPSSLINPYRIVIVLRLIILAFFFRFRLSNPVHDAFALWLISVVCEIWFALSWILDQFPKWFPITRETYLDRLSIRFEREGQTNRLAPVDVFVSIVDKLKESPISTANAVLSVLSVEYPVEKVSCYVSDDGASKLVYDTLSETAEFSRIWVPFCKRHGIEPRAPEFYFSQKIDYLQDNVQSKLVRERRAMKREYEEFKVKINALVAKAQKKPEDGWVMQDGTSWPGNNTHDHPGMIQVYLGSTSAQDAEGKELPKLVYISREKRPGYKHHMKAGSMNALVRVSAVLTNAPYILNMNCDQYVNNSKVIREAMCFLMDPQHGKKICYVQFPQRYDGIDCHDRYANHNVVFFDIIMKGLDGIQGPVYVGTGCMFNRLALYGYDPPLSEKRPKMHCDCWPSWCCCCCDGSRKSKFDLEEIEDGSWTGSESESGSESGSRSIFDLDDIEEGLEGYDEPEKSSFLSQENMEKRFGQSPVFIASTLIEDGGLPEGNNARSLIKEAIHVISCGYEKKTEWGKEIGWIYGSVTEHILTGFKMHCRGWKSVYCMPKRVAFRGSAPINLSDRLHQVMRWAIGSIEISLSPHFPLWYGYGGKLKWLERLAYTNIIVYPFTSIPLLVYCTIPAVCLLTGKFIIPTLTNLASLCFMALIISIILTTVLELRWSGISIEDWWRNEQFWVIGGVSAHLFALFQGLLKVLAGVNTILTATTKAKENTELEEIYLFKWTALLVPPTTLVILNLVGVVAGISDAINNGYGSWGPLFGKLIFAFWVIVHLYPFLKGLMGKQNRTPTVVVLWSILLALIFSLIWVKIDPFLPKQTGLVLKQCGVEC